VVSAAGLGWGAKLLEGVNDDDLAVLLGVHLQHGIEAAPERVSRPGATFWSPINVENAWLDVGDSPSPPGSVLAS